MPLKQRTYNGNLLLTPDQTAEWAWKHPRLIRVYRSRIRRRHTSRQVRVPLPRSRDGRQRGSARALLASSATPLPAVPRFPVAAAGSDHAPGRLLLSHSISRARPRSSCVNPAAKRSRLSSAPKGKRSVAGISAPFAAVQSQTCRWRLHDTEAIPRHGEPDKCPSERGGHGEADVLGPDLR